jgi:hypothetical protein
VVLDVQAANQAPVGLGGGGRRHYAADEDGVPCGLSVTDDNLPCGFAVLTVAWSVVSGPAVAKFANAAVAQTTATLDTAGTYVLRLTASDGELTSTDDVTIDVLPRPAPSAPSKLREDRKVK